MIVLLLLLDYIFVVLSQINYCKRGELTTTRSGECLSSTLANVQNCCYECLQINVNNQSAIIKCGSLYDLGFDICTDESRAAAKIKCGGGVLYCLCNDGSDKSQVSTGSSIIKSQNALLLVIIIYISNFFIIKY